MNLGYRHRLIAVASTALAVGLAACGSSNSPTGPKTPTPAQLASYFDSIYSSYNAAGTSADSEIAFLVAEYVELSPAFGAHRSTISLSTGSGTQTWYGFTYGAYEGADTAFETIAYSDNSLTNVLVIGEEYDSTASESFAAIFTNTFGAESEDSVASVSAAVSSAGSACSLQSGLAADSIFQSVATEYTCQTAGFTVSASATFAASANLGALQTVSFSNVGFNGILFDEISGQHVTLGPTRLAGIVQRLRALQARGAMLRRTH